jgi:hypothetical protein
MHSRPRSEKATAIEAGDGRERESCQGPEARWGRDG